MTKQRRLTERQKFRRMITMNIASRIVTNGTAIPSLQYAGDEDVSKSIATIAVSIAERTIRILEEFEDHESEIDEKPKSKMDKSIFNINDLRDKKKAAPLDAAKETNNDESNTDK